MKKVKINQVYQTGVILLKITYITKDSLSKRYYYKTINGGIFDKTEDYFDTEYFQDCLNNNEIILVDSRKEN